MIRPGAIGDCILSLPALEFLKADYTEVWISTPVVPLIQFADCARPIVSTGLELVIESDLPPGLKEKLQGFDEIISWYGTNRLEFRNALNAIHPRCQFLDALPSADWNAYASDFFLQQVGGLQGTKTLIKIDAATRRKVAIQPFSGSPRKNWPLEKFRELARQLPVDVEWTAGPEEVLEGAWRTEDLLELACWLKGAAVFVGNDSGISHLAAAVGVPSVVLFGDTNPIMWAPRGDRVTVIQHQPLNELAVDDVLNAVTAYL